MSNISCLFYNVEVLSNINVIATSVFFNFVLEKS